MLAKGAVGQALATAGRMDTGMAFLESSLAISAKSIF